MKKTPPKKARFKSKNKNRLSKPLNPTRKVENERTLDTKIFGLEFPVDSPENITNEMNAESENTEDWDDPQDRSDDLVNIRDPFIQAPEREAQTAPEIPHGLE